MQKKIEGLLRDNLPRLLHLYSTQRGYDRLLESIAEEVCEVAAGRDPAAILSAEDYLSVVEMASKITKKEIASKHRGRNVVVARQLYCYLCRCRTGYSLKAIAKHIGGRDHTSIIYSAAQFKNLLSIKNELATELYHNANVLIGGAFNQ